MRQEEKLKQQRICTQLYDKVARWREQKFEALEIQQKIDDMLARQAAEEARVEGERLNKKRMQQKQAVRTNKHFNFNLRLGDLRVFL